MFKYLVSKKGYTFVEVMTVVVVLGILVAVAVPVFGAGLNNSRKKDCESNRIMINSVIEQVMTGQMDNGKPQKIPYKFYMYQGDQQIEISRSKYLNIQEENSKKQNEEDKIKVYVEEKLMLFFDKNYTSLTTIEYNNEIVKCFKLTNKEEEKDLIFTLSDIRGGWHGSIDYNSFKNSNISTDYDDYKYDAEIRYSISNPNVVQTDSRYYLKKRKLGDIPFYTYLSNQEIPICPFTDDDNEYYYYILEDGSVHCTNPECK